ncbi:MAG TPA: hypothetical protein VFV16_09525 [Candidatus Nitrosotalea sp.]|nr:hypothetical protein [Candidatus Nitrosotalea sp.]
MPDTQQFVKPQELQTYDKVREALVHTVLEKTLHSAGIYQTITSEIEKTYNCSLYDCYEHPEYFSSILESRHGEMYDLVAGAINKQLEMFSYEKPIARFLEIINS